jgi:hypothetical protein
MPRWETKVNDDGQLLELQGATFAAEVQESRHGVIVTVAGLLTESRDEAAIARGQRLAERLVGLLASDRHGMS